LSITSNLRGNLKMDNKNLQDLFVNTAAPVAASILRKQEIVRDLDASWEIEKAERNRITQPAKSEFRALCDLIVTIGQESDAFSASDGKKGQNYSNSLQLEDYPNFLKLEAGNRAATIHQKIDIEKTAEKLTVKDITYTVEDITYCKNTYNPDRSPLVDNSRSKSQVVTSEEDIVKFVSTWAAQVAPNKMAEYAHSKSASAPTPKAP
jgi:hypothetical protein